MDYYLDSKGDQVQALHLSSELVKVAAVWSEAVEVEEIDPLDESKRYPALNVRTRDGVKRASLGDYILKHSDGTFDVKKRFEFIREHRNWEP